MAKEGEAETALGALVAACSASGRPPVIVTQGAQKTAERDFGLATAASVRAFVSSGGLEHPEHINTCPWEKNPTPAVPVDVYAFRFSSGPTTKGYIAFLRGLQGAWVIKSFKKDSQAVVTSLGPLLAGLPLTLKKGPER